MSALREKVRQHWLSKQGFYAPSAGQSFKGGRMSSVEVNAQKPNYRRKRNLSSRKRKPRYKPF